MSVKINLENIVLDTNRLILRAFRLTDLADLHETVCTKDVLKMSGRLPHKSLDDTKKMLLEFIDNSDVFAILLKQTGKIVGFVGFFEDTRIRDDIQFCQLKALEIDYLVSREYWGQGIATEAVKAVLEFCFNKLNLDAIIATHALTNPQSKRVLEKCRFEFIKPAPFFNQADQSCHDGAMYLCFSKKQS